MRIYEGSPRQDWEEVLRSVGAYLDDRGMRGLVFVETDTGFIIQGTTVQGDAGSASGEAMGKAARETLTLHDDDVGKFMDEAIARRGRAAGPDAEALRGAAPRHRQVPRRAAPARHLLLRARRRVHRSGSRHSGPGWPQAGAGRVHPRRHRRDDGQGAGAPARTPAAPAAPGWQGGSVT